MQKNKELQELFNNYKNLSQEELDKLLALIVKQEKERLGLNLPIQLKIDWDNLKSKAAGGDSNIIYNDEKKRYEHLVRINGNEWYRQYLANRNKTAKQGEMTFESSLDSLYHLIANVCHEMKHAYQNEVTEVKSEVSDTNALIWLKQAMVITDETFYRDSHNYKNMPREVDAYDYQYREALEYIKTYTTIEKDNPSFFATLQETANRNEKENVKPLEELTFIVDGKQVKVTEYFNQNMESALANNPNITPSVIENSILKYEYNSDGTQKSFEQLMADKQKRLESLDKNVANYHQQVQKIEQIYTSIIANYPELQRQEQEDEKVENHKQLGYTREENGTIYIEKQQQILKNYSGNDIGNRIITWRSDIENGTQDIETIGALENDDGKYQMREVTKILGGELEEQRKEMTQDNKNTGDREQTVFQRDGKGNEMYYKRINGQISFKITKTPRGITIDNYDNGQLMDSYEYDENGKAIEGMEMPGIEQLDDNYVENFFDFQIPYFVAENGEIAIEENEEAVLDTERLGKETLEEQKDTNAKVDTERDMAAQMQEKTINKTGVARKQNEYNEQPERKTRTTANPESFREKLNFDISPEMYQEVLERHRKAEKAFEKEMEENPEKRGPEQTEYGVK